MSWPPSPLPNPEDYALPGPQAKGTAAPGLFQLQAHPSPDRSLSKIKPVDHPIQFSLDLTDQVGYTGAMAAHQPAPQLRFRREDDGVMRLVSNPPPGTPPEARRAFAQLAHALSSVPPPTQFNPQHPLHESEHEMAQMPLSRRPTKADAERLMAEGARILNELDAIRSKYLGGVEPTEDGAVITFQRSFPNIDELYSYAAMRADGRWFLTGSMGSVAFTYDELLYWCEEGTTVNFRLVADNAFRAELSAPAEAVSDEVAGRLSDKGVTVVNEPEA